MVEGPNTEYVVDEGSLHKYRTEIPNTVVKGLKSRGLSIYAKWLYVYYKSVAGDSGKCNQNTTTLVGMTGISRGQITKARQELIDAGLIRLIEGKRRYRDSFTVRITDIWLQNMQEFCVHNTNTVDIENDKAHVGEDDFSVHGANTKNPGVRITNTGVHGTNSSVRKAASKKISLKKIPLKNEESSPNGEDMVDSENRPPVSPKYTKGFEQFWKEYPVKKAKQKAWKSWKSKRLEGITPAIVQSVVQHRTCDQDWQKGFIPHPATYLNGGGWEDELQKNESPEGVLENRVQAAVAKAFAEEPVYESQ